VAKLDRRPAEKVALAGLMVQLFAAVLAFIFARVSGAATVRVLFWQAVLALPVWLMALVHLRQARLADEEEDEWKRLEAERAATGARGRLFEADEIQAFAARNRLRFLERFLQPALSAVLVIFLALLVVVMFATGTLDAMTLQKGNVALSIVFLAALTFVLLLIAYYAAGMSRERAWRPLRAAASFMLLTMLFGVVSCVALGLGWWDISAPDLFIAKAMLAVLGIVAIEILLNFTLNFYRPRVEGVEARPSYDSRLLGMMSEPGGVLKTVADTLDYQFGFRVSQTWFYQFAEQMIAPFVLFLIVALYGLTCFEIVKPEERGVLERFGAFRRVVRPGLTVKWPWPIDIVHRFPAAKVRAFGLGHEGRRTVGDTILWSARHYEKEIETMVAAAEPSKDEKVAPVSLIVASSRVRYRVRDDDESIRDWYYRCADPEALVESLCERVQQKFLAGVDYYDVMGHGRHAASGRLRELMQAAVDRERLGTEILGVGLEEIHPPINERAQLVQAYHGVVQAREQQHVTVYQARTGAVKDVTAANIEATKMESGAKEDYAQKAYVSEAEAKQFLVRAEVFEGAYEVFAARKLLAAMTDLLPAMRKIVITPKADLRHIRLNLEDPAGGDIGTIEFEPVITGEEKGEKK